MSHIIINSGVGYRQRFREQRRRAKQEYCINTDIKVDREVWIYMQITALGSAACRLCRCNNTTSNTTAAATSTLRRILYVAVQLPRAGTSWGSQSDDMAVAWLCPVQF